MWCVLSIKSEITKVFMLKLCVGLHLGFYKELRLVVQILEGRTEQQNC